MNLFLCLDNGTEPPLITFYAQIACGQMPRFRFPIVDGIRLDDPVGIEFADFAAAKSHADLIAKLMPSTHDRHVLVIDDAETELYRVPVKGRSEA